MAARKPVTAPELLLKIVLAGTQSHYETRGLIDDARLDQMLRAGKQILWKSHQEGDVRQNLGFSPQVWNGLTSCLSAAIPTLEVQSFCGPSGSSSDLIAKHYFGLIKDIERLNDLCTIARNLLATTKRAQNLAAEWGFDQCVLRLIDVCVRVSSRGFDGEVESRDEKNGTVGRNEEKWQKVVNLYKRLLITSLQFLHNFVMHNEQRKLVLWLDLFGNARGQQTTVEERNGKSTSSDQIDSLKERAKRVKATAAKLISNNLDGNIPSYEGGLGYNIDDVHALFDLMTEEESPDPDTQEAANRLMDKIRKDMETLSGLSAKELDEQPEKLLMVGERLRGALPPHGPEHGLEHDPQKERTLEQKVKTDPITALPELGQYGDLAVGGVNTEITDADMVMPRTSASAADTLQEAKEELMTRLRETSLADQQRADYNDELSKQVTEEDEVHGDDDSLEAEASEEEDLLSDEEDAPRSTSPERGLLTDVPLVLGPTEIEALPMIIQAGIVDLSSSQRSPSSGKNMQSVRTHILLASVAGRNLLRELLIFIAAWDLPDDEFYFKMMVQIMEGILSCGLMSHAYSDFGQAKDIISPAQAVAVKILTSIFRSKYSPASVNKDPGSKRVQPASAQRLNGSPHSLTRVDVLTVRYIFTVFRGNIIPETCALIYLQGQIKNGLSSAEDFPLNLWDMERVYEGVYQFLEFFAVLTESADWKSLLVEWEIVYDLVTLMRELEGGVRRGGFVDSKGAVKDVNGKSNGAKDAMEPIPPSSGTEAPAREPSPAPPLAAEDPALFEWRNLKKLIVLVLSSLVWKCPTVQDQIREHGGLDVILGCTMYDAHNPYIKEHAVMCLKFLLEGNEENQRLVKELDANGVAETPEGVDAFVDRESGKVKVGGLRRASEGSVRERFGKMDVRGEQRIGRVIGEELDAL